VLWSAGWCPFVLFAFGRRPGVVVRCSIDFFVAGGGVCPGGCRWCRLRFASPEADGRRSVVAGAGGLAWFLDRVAVVAGAFDRAGAAAVPAFGIGPARDLGQDLGQGPVPVLRGEKPPFRWRYGGPVVACG